MTALVPLSTVSLFAPGCAGGETQTGNPDGTGGRTGSGSGGSTVSGSGGSGTPSGSGGSGTASGSGGSGTPSGSGGSGAPSGSGGSGAPSGSGGATGGGGTTGGGGAGAPATGGNLTITGGYVTSGTFHGYAYTFTGPMTGSKATIAPADFMMATQFCANGTIQADTTYASVAGMGFNVNQIMATTATSPPIGEAAATGTGLVVNVGNVTGLTLAPGAGSQLRVQIQGAADYCAPVAASGVNMIPWTMFNTKCWNTTETGAMAFTAGSMIKSVALVVPSGAAVVGPFNFCLLEAHPYP